MRGGTAMRRRSLGVICAVIGLAIGLGAGVASAQSAHFGRAAQLTVLCLRDANGQITGTTSATVFPGSACTIPANVLTAGRALNVFASVNITTQGVTGSSFSARLGGTALFTMSGLTSQTPRRLNLNVIAIDATTVFVAAMFELHSGAAANGAGFTGEVTVPDLTTADRVLDLQLTPGAQTDDHTLRYYEVTLRRP